MEKFIKAIFFYPLMWLRAPFLMVGKLLGGLFFLGALFALIFGQNQEHFWSMFLSFSGLSFFFYLLNQFYDQILLKLNPTGNKLYLSQ